MNSVNHKKGLTLIEMTVVIVGLLTLISISISVAQAWKGSANRAQCITNLRTFQKGVRSYILLNEGRDNNITTNSNGTWTLNSITPLNDFFPVNNETSTITCPANGVYDFTRPIPAIGEVWVSCSLEASRSHIPSNSGNW